MADQPAPSSPPPASPLVGRERELATLRDALVSALAGRGSLVLIGGEAGIGKTALAEATLTKAREKGALALVGRCYDLAETPPYGPWAEALERAPTGDAYPRSPDLAGGGDTGSRAALAVQILGFLADLAARRPLAILLEDLHWADPASLETLRAVGRPLPALPLLLVATYRADEVARGHPLYALLPPLVREARAARLDLRPLAEGELGALVAARYALPPADAARLVAYLLRRAEGNPFFAGELLRALEEEGRLRPEGADWALGELDAAGVPPLLRQVVDGRIDRLGAGARDLLAIAAVIGHDVPLALWATVAGREEEGLLPLVERVVAARLLDDPAGGERVRFAHALVREALYAGIVAPRRRAWHRRVAEALLALPAQADPDELAYHLRQAGDPRAVEWLIRAGRRAERAAAWLSAAERYEAALALRGAGDDSERARLLFRLAWLRRFAEPERGLAALAEAGPLAAGAGDRAALAVVTYGRGFLLCRRGEIGAGLAEMARGLAALEAAWSGEGRPDGRGAAEALLAPREARAVLAQWLALVGRYGEACALAGQVLAGEGDDRADALAARADAWYALAEARAAAGQPTEARDAYARAAEAYRALAHPVYSGGTIADLLRWVALPFEADRPAECARLAGEVARAWAEAGGVYPLLLPRVPRMLLGVLTGDWHEAAEVARAASATSHGSVFRSAARIVLGTLARERGDPAAAWALLREVLPEGPRTEPGGTYYLPALALARLAVALALDVGDEPGARAWLDAHDRWLAWGGAVLGAAEGALLHAECARAAGDPSAARDHALRALARAGDPRQPLALLAAHRLLGELATAERRHAGAARHLDAALALADACGAPYERALTLVASAEARLLAGDRDAAWAALEEAGATFAALGAPRARARADALVARLGRAARGDPHPDPPFGLTTREAAVLRLVAEGLTNAEVADRLSISPRTVDHHLRAIYGKLGVTSRTAAARFVADIRPGA